MKVYLPIIICGLTLIAVFAALANGQTLPPTSGDWIINDLTSFNDTDLIIPGHIVVEDYGSLLLRNVNITFTAIGKSVFRSSPNATLVVEGGRIRSTRANSWFILMGRSEIRGVYISNTDGILISTWNATVTNCTIHQSARDGIIATPIDQPHQALLIANNTIIEPRGMGIGVRIEDFSDTAVEVIIAGNTISRSQSNGIMVIAQTDRGRFVLENNEVDGAVDHGILVDLSVENLDLSLNSTSVRNSTEDGLFVMIDSSNPMFDTIEGIISEKNGKYGVTVYFVDEPWSNPHFEGWVVKSNPIAGLLLYNLACATLEDSHFDNRDATIGDFHAYNSTLSIYRTFHGKASAFVQGSNSEITSYRYLNLSFTWQNGKPCKNRTVEILNKTGEVLFASRTDESGWLTNRTTWDWRMNLTKTWQRSVLEPHLSGNTSELWGPELIFDHDYEAILVIEDNVVPTLNVISPFTGQCMNTTILMIVGNCTDDHSGVYLVEVSFDEEHGWNQKTTFRVTDPVERNPGIVGWNITFESWPEGTLSIFVRAFDLANYPDGTFSTITIVNVTVDRTAPTVTIVEPPPPGVGGYITNQTGLTIRGIVDPDTVQVTVDGSQANLVGTEFYSSVPLSEGMNDLNILATDRAGNVGRFVIRVWSDTIPPSIAIEFPPNNFWTNSSLLIIQGSTDAVGTRVLVGGASAAIQISGFEWRHELNLVKGLNEIPLEAIDKAGNRRSTILIVYFDDEPPEIEILEPRDGAFVNTSVIRVMGTVSPDLSQDIIKINGAMISAVGGIFSSYLPPMEEGPADIVFYATDRAGNTAQVVIHVIVDTVAPPLSIAYPNDGILTNQSMITVRGETEAGALVAVCDQFAVVVEGVFSSQVRLEEGPNEVLIEAWDEAGNQVRGIRRVLLDTIPPVVHFDEVEDDSIVAHENPLNLTGRTEPSALLVFIVEDLEIQVNVSLDGTFSHTFVLRKDTRRIRVIASDEAGNLFQMNLSIGWAGEPPLPNWSHSPVVWAIIIGSTLLIIGAISVVEVTRYSVIMFFIPLYSKLKKGEVLNNETRYKIHGLIIENPGMHYKAILREFDLSNGAGAYHLDVLEREGFIKSARDGRLKRFYSMSTKIPKDHKPPADELKRMMLTIIAERPGVSQTDIINELGMPKEIVGYHLRGLMTEGMLTTSKTGKFTVYHIKRK